MEQENNEEIPQPSSSAGEEVAIEDDQSFMDILGNKQLTKKVSEQKFLEIS